MGNAWEWMKEHPYATAGIVFVIGIIFVMLFFRGGSSAPVDNTAAQVAAAQATAAQSGNELAALQAQLQASGNATNAGVATNANDNASAITVATIQAQSAENQATIAAKAASDAAYYNANATLGVSTVQASATSFGAYQSTLQKWYDDLTLGNITNTKNALDFLAGQTGPAGPNVINQGYLSYTPNGIVFGAQSSTAGNAPWGGAAFPEWAVSQLPAGASTPSGVALPPPPPMSNIPIGSVGPMIPRIAA